MTRPQFTVSTDKSKLDIDAIHDFICNRSYWGKGRSQEAIWTTIDHSLCFGIYDDDAQFLGFARVVTDYVVVAHLMDFFILEEHRGQGIGKQLLEQIIHYPSLKEIKFWRLDTNDAHELYERFGFKEPAYPEKIMEKRSPAKNNLHLVHNSPNGR